MDDTLPAAVSSEIPGPLVDACPDASVEARTATILTVLAVAVLGFAALLGLFVG